MSTIMISFGWVASRSDWQISRADQIRVEGNQYLSDQAVRSMLAIPYPKLIMELAPEQLATKLTAQPAIASVKVDRGLLPPHLTVQIQDLPPVARVVQSNDSQVQNFVDERGRQLPLSSYWPTIWPSLPTLQVKLPATGNCSSWSQLYPIVQTSRVKILVVDCQNPQNLFLETEIGTIRLGTPGENARLKEQIQQLDRLVDWQKYTDVTAVEYIDLENSTRPMLQIKQGAVKIEPVMSSPQN